MLEPQIMANLLYQVCDRVDAIGNRHRASAQRQRQSDQNYSEGDKFEQIIWAFPASTSIIDEMPAANA